jgi:hypothetical protein
MAEIIFFVGSKKIKKVWDDASEGQWAAHWRGAGVIVAAPLKLAAELQHRGNNDPGNLLSLTLARCACYSQLLCHTTLLIIHPKRLLATQTSALALFNWCTAARRSGRDW